MTQICKAGSNLNTYKAMLCFFVQASGGIKNIGQILDPQLAFMRSKIVPKWIMLQDWGAWATQSNSCWYLKGSKTDYSKQQEIDHGSPMWIEPSAPSPLGHLFLLWLMRPLQNRHHHLWPPPRMSSSSSSFLAIDFLAGALKKQSWTRLWNQAIMDWLMDKQFLIYNHNSIVSGCVIGLVW